MSFTDFIESHPELSGMSLDEQLNAYDLYLAGIAESLDDWILN